MSRCESAALRTLRQLTRLDRVVAVTLTRSRLGMPSFGLGHDKTSKLKMADSPEKFNKCCRQQHLAQNAHHTARQAANVVSRPTDRHRKTLSAQFSNENLRITRRQPARANRVSCHLTGGKSRKTLGLVPDSELATLHANRLLSITPSLTHTFNN